jgi:arginyl-tRNA synthetase
LQFFKVLDLMGHPWASTLSHVNFGMVLGMSTRKGTAVFLEEILNESKRVMHDVMRKNEAKYNAIEDPEYTSDKLGITAVKIQDMAAKRCVFRLRFLLCFDCETDSLTSSPHRINNYEFKWERMTSFEGDTGSFPFFRFLPFPSVLLPSSTLSGFPLSRRLVTALLAVPCRPHPSHLLLTSR